MKRLMVFLTVLTMLFCSGAAFGATYIVGWPVVAPITHGTIQTAIGVSVPFDTILIDASYNPGAAGEVFPVGIFVANLTIQGRFGGESIIGNGTDKIFVNLASNCTILDLFFANAGGGDGLWMTTLGLGGAICNWSANNTNITNCQFVSNAGAAISDGAGIYIEYSSNVTIHTCQFFDNVASLNGGGVAVYYSQSILITKCLFQGNLAATNVGGGVYVYSCTGITVWPYTVHIELSNFYYNTSAFDGGGISWWQSDGVIDQNHIGTMGGNGSAYGGGISVVNCNTTPSLTLISLNDIFHNTATGTLPCPWNGGWGGGIFIENSDNTVQVSSNNTISTNTATFFGGGIAINAYLAPCYPVITGNTITTNTVTSACAPSTPNGGGGISVRYDFTVAPANHPFIGDNDIIGNSVVGLPTFGGGIGSFYASPDIDDNKIIGNLALDYGGGIAAIKSYDDMPNQGMIVDNIIKGNQAGADGGGIYLSGCGHPAAFLQLEYNTVDKNACPIRGGGMLAVGSNVVVRNSNFTKNSATTGTAVATHCGVALEFFNNTVADNTAPVPSDAIALDSAADIENNIFANHPSLFAIREYFGDKTVTCLNNLFWNNAGIYDDGALGPLDLATLNAQAWAIDNISGDPLLDPSYHINNYNSPAVNAGLNLAAKGVLYDIDKQSRPLGPNYDIGSDEVPPGTSVTDWFLYRY